MVPVTSFQEQGVAVFGLGGSGLVTARALVAGGARVVAWDDAPARVEAAREAGIPVGDLKTADWSAFAALVLAPGVPLTHPEPHWTVVRARDAGVGIIGDVELFARERRAQCPAAPLIAITGTNGKSTTTALVAHLLRHAGLDAQMGGNIGVPVLELAPPQTGRPYVVECSSYQIDLAPTLDADVGVLLNLAPDHLDRHGTMDNYAAIKTRLVAQGRTAVIGVDDARCAAIADALEADGHTVVRISGHTRLEKGVFGHDGALYAAQGGKTVKVADLAGIDTLRGDHNAQNAAAAFASLRALGIAPDVIAAGFATFSGLAHRMELVTKREHVLFVNDSKATNADAAARALSSFDRIYWILGGKAKSDGIGDLTGYFSRIKRAYLIGEAAEAFARTLGDAVPHVTSTTIARAVAQAASDAAADSSGGEAVVLLSPACASFDQFANFEKRGDAFRAAVMALGESNDGKEVA
ncbi:UDP-N-acetylmuramoyl-L-alanine--D-glutamate ligase [Breoghania sp. L-A4]|uniref:UDP-N-acetylmuramoyl-L-alanine--D-glutamate ligase n=1 Tax=Breoghania sp. L-A4 TaxID=2304600 RepID=UPI000E35B31F|nr:UDP-N-acetylmuramoyl-L-alanine--D-glutamate ligase [Breoghania sp. L-A4]AXS41334.1 UDP-N-acetylmuramoyl-L-alanine--D-glutamate ligase [Breoghania sp. L-A4]